jgi:hypothetical protein
LLRAGVGMLNVSKSTTQALAAPHAKNVSIATLLLLLMIIMVCV